ncbi:centromere-associated protein E-like [Acipenser oxyrinchus oxyrinchus]|uniref:Centromere-associated protein E n=1 Tax=Acipenser oxyrinchus oxyrinchus TaxID=40147 RepID=A0AAD8GI71_ACIOX|nr:centromere-associated protein E-like [Acipenser oxyrinchus oxyrinchus]
MSEESAVKVCVRVRPLIQREKNAIQDAEEAVPLYWKTDKHAVCQVDGTKSFNFDRVFNTDETTDKVYQDVAQPLVVSAVNGYNGTIFAYGQTSSGKTFTMMGSQSSLGVIPLAIQDIFKTIDATPNREFLLRVSYMEIYNETVTDLLCDSRKKKPLEIREDMNRTVYVADLSEEVVVTAKQVLEWIKKGEKNRHYGETKMNERSSRSHTIFRMILESREKSEPSNGENVDGAVMVSHLNLVDLAGSERASQTGAAGLRLKEGCNINRSLFVIGQVIKKLSDGHAGGFINYRDSKLTRILQNSLGGNAKTVIICTITPATIEETLSTLQFASTAKHMKNDPHVNEVLDDEALMKRYRNEIVDLKKRLEEVFSETRAQATEKIELAQLLLEKEQLQREQEDRIKNLTKMIITSDFSKKEQKIKNKRRVTWAPGKLRDSLQSSGGFKFDGLPTSEPFVKRMKCEMSTLAEFDDSDCTEIEDSWSHTLDDPFELDASRNVAVRRSRNAYSTLLEEYPLFDGQESACDVASPQMDDKEAKIANLERQLQSERNEKVQLTGMRSFLEKRVSELEQQLQSQTVEVKGAEHKEVKRVLDEQIADLERQLLEKELEQEYVGKGLKERILELEQQHSTSKEEYTESKAALEKRIMELEHSLHIQESQGKDNLQDQLYQKDLLETIQLCEALEAEKEKLLSEMDVLRDACDNMTLENEGLRNEKKELQFKLKEKNEMHEFEALEKEVRHEHEADLMHEITSLKAGTENAEVCIQGLKAELSRAKELIADLQSSVDKDLVEQIQQLRHSLEDAETVTRDTKKEFAILRSENLEMKEKMDEMTVKYQQMEKDMLTSCSQLEAEKLRYKNMQTDLQKELQQAFNENTKLTTLLDGKVPKDLIERIELERRVADLKKELKQILADKTALKEEVDASSALQHLPEKVAGLMKQVCRVTNELCIVTSEREGLISKIAEKDSRIHELTEAAKQASEKLSETVSKLNDAEMKVVDLTQQLSEVQQLLQSTQNCEIKAESESLIADKEQLLNDLQTLEIQLTTLSDELKQKSVEVSGLQSEKEALTESLDRLNVELELRTNVSQLERMEQGNKLQQLRGEMEALNQEKDCLQQVLETVQSERDALTNVQQDLEKTMTDLCNTREELNQTQQLVVGLNNQIEEKEAQLASMEERLVERKLSECVEKEVSVDTLGYSNLLTEKEELLESRDRLAVEIQHLQEEFNTSTSRLACMERDALEQTCRLQHLQEKMATTTQARDELHQKLEVMQLNTEAVNRVTEELKLVTSERDILLAERRGTVPSSETDLQMEALQEQISSLVKERDELQEILEGVRTEKNQLKADMQENIELSFEIQEQLRVSQQELEQQQRLVNDLKSQIAEKELQLSNIEVKEAANLEDKVLQLTEALNLLTSERDHLMTERALASNMAQQSEPELHLGELQEQISSLTKERDELQEILGRIKTEKKQLEADLQENIEMAIDTQEELRQQQQQIDDLKKQVAVRESQVVSGEENLSGIKELQEKMTRELKVVTCERDNLLAERRQCGSEYELQLGVLQEQISSLTKERDKLQEILECVRAEKDQLQADLQENIKMAVETQQQLRSTQEHLRQQEQLVSDWKSQTAERKSLLTDSAEENKDSFTQELQEKVLHLSEELKLVKCEHDQLLAERRDIVQGPETEPQLGVLQEQILSLSKERDELQEILDGVRAEKNQLKADMQENIEMNIEIQEELRQQQQLVSDLQVQTAQRESELQEKSNQVMEELKLVTRERDHLAERRGNNQGLETELQLGELQEQISALTKERDELQEMLESVETEKNQLKAEMQENIEMTTGIQVELRQQQQLVSDLQIQTGQRESELQEKFETQLKHQQQVVDEFKNQVAEKEAQISSLQHKLAEEINQVTEELKLVTRERDHLAEKRDSDQGLDTELQLGELQEQISSLTKERDELQEILESVRAEINQNLEMASKNQDELRSAQEELRQQQQVVSDLRTQTAKRESELQEKVNQETHELKLVTSERDHLLAETRDAAELGDLQEQISSLTKERNELQEILECVRAEKNQMKDDLHENIEMAIETQEELRQQQQLVSDLKNQIAARESELLEKVNQVTEELKLVTSEQNQLSSLTMERDELQGTLKSVRAEMDQLRKTSEEIWSKSETQLKHQQQVVEEFKSQVAEKEAQISSLQHKLAEQINQVTEELKLVTRERDHLAEKRDGDQGLFTELQLGELQEQISSLTKERDELQEILESVKAENNQNLEMASKKQGELRSAQEELRQQQQLVSDLRTQTAKRESELQEQVNQVTVELKLVTSEQNQLSSLTMERDELQGTLKSVRAEMDQLRKTSEEIWSKSETQLKHQQQVVEEFKSQVSEKAAQISSLQHKLAEQSENYEILRQTEEELMHRRQEVEQLRCQVAKKEAQISNMQETQADKLLSLTEELKQSATNQSHIMAQNLSLVQSQERLNKELEELRTNVSRLERIELEALEHEKKLSQLQADMAALAQERDELQKTLDHLQVTMNVEKSNIELRLSEEKKENQRLLEKIEGFEEQVASMGSKCNPSVGEMENLSLRLEGTDQQLKDCMQSFHKLKDQFESWFSNMDTILLNDFGSQKELVSQLLSPLSSAQTKPVEILNSDIQRMNLQFKFVLKKLKFLYTALAQNQMEHHQLTAQYEMDCYEENKKQELLVKKIQFLTDNGSTKYSDQCETERFSGLLEKRDLQLQEIRQILSELEHIFIKTDTELQQELQDREKLKLKLMALDSSSIPDLMEILSQEKTRIKQHVELLSQAQKSLALKFTDFDKKRKSFRFQSNKQLEEEKKKSETLIQQLDSITNVVPNSGAALLLQEENQRLLDKLEANEMEIKQMQLKIKELQGALGIAEENALEQGRRTNALQGDLKELKAKLTEKENAIKGLKINLVHIEAKVKKGEAPYTEELERLKTKVVKMEFERTVLSRTCQQEIDSLKATLDLKEDNLRSLREKLRRMQQDHDETMHEDHRNQHPTNAGPLACVSGFGIVQSTAVLVMKAEKAKLEAEVHQLKKKNDHLDSTVLNLQDEVSKWKVRARKLKDSSKAMNSLTDIERHSECLPLSPVKQQVSVPQTPSPRRKLASFETLVLDSPKSKFFDSQPDSMSVSRPTPFFDNSSLGMVPGLEPTKEAGRETQDWWASAPRKNDTVSECKTQ